MGIIIFFKNILNTHPNTHINKGLYYCWQMFLHDTTGVLMVYNVFNFGRLSP